MIPELNKEYDYFDDGKINPSRHDKVIITELVRFNKIDEKTKANWLKEVEQRHWLYNKETDYFVKGRLKETKKDVIFVRTLNNEWFSLGWWAGCLDTDGSLAARLNRLDPRESVKDRHEVLFKCMEVRAGFVYYTSTVEEMDKSAKFNRGERIQKKFRNFK